VTSAELKSYLRITDTADDTLVALWVTTVSRNVDDFCGRQFGKVASAEDRYYPTFYDRPEGAWFAELDDLQDTTGLTFADKNGTAVTVATSTADRVHAAAPQRRGQRQAVRAGEAHRLDRRGPDRARAVGLDGGPVGRQDRHVPSGRPAGRSP
jgi:hypothetical protein